MKNEKGETTGSRINERVPETYINDNNTFLSIIGLLPFAHDSVTVTST